MTLVEEWRPIAGYEGRYSVSNFGHVKSLRRQLPGKSGSLRTIGDRILSPALGTKGQGYLGVSLWKDGAGRTLEIHRLVATAFCDRAGGSEVNHIDGDSRNNHSTNLEWCTRAHNMAHAASAGRMRASSNPNKVIRFSEGDIASRRASRLAGDSYCGIAKRYATSRGYVREICLRQVRL